MITRKLSAEEKYIVILLIALIIVFFFLDYSFGPKRNENLEKRELPITIDSQINQLVINEVMTNNSGCYVNQDNEKTDYVELYNGSLKEIALKNYGLSDRKEKVKWFFPDITIKPKEYLVVSLSGDKETKGLNANFKLTSKGDEYLVLTSNGGNIIDLIKTCNLGENQVIQRDEKGDWCICDTPTPGYENSIYGKGCYKYSLKGNLEESLLVNEILPKNKGNYTNSDKIQTGFLELLNNTDYSIKLNEYYLSNDQAIPFKYQLPEITLASHDIYCLNLGKYYGTNDYCGFNLDNKLLLSHDGKIVYQYEYASLSNGVALYRDDKGDYYQTSSISPGYPNTLEGIKEFQEKYLVKADDLIINEVMSSNSSFLKDNNDYYDWIELYNNSLNDINLNEYHLSNGEIASLLPEVILKPGKYYTVLASGDGSLTKKYCHLDFKVTSNEAIYLYKGNKLIDSLHINNIPLGYSYGRMADGLGYMSSPTPNKENEHGKTMVLDDVSFSLMGGVYDNVKNLTIELSGPGEIYYTTNGSIPTKDSKKYTGPITITKTTVIRARAIQEGYVSSKIAYNSYIVNEKHKMAVMALTIKPSDYKYLINHSQEKSRKQAYAQFFYQDGEYFQTPCSLALSGGFGRTLAKKSYTLRFDSPYGAKSLDYQVFSNRECNCYDALLLRSASTDALETMIKDILATSLMDEYTEVDTQAYIPCILYINGEYYGIYSLREKINSHFIENHYNVDTTKLNMVNTDKEAEEGSYDSYDKLRAYCRSHNMANSSSYKYFTDHVNIEKFVDYWIAEAYLTNYDMKNTRYFQVPGVDDNKWNPILFDLDHGFEWNDLNYYYYMTDSRGIGAHKKENDLIRFMFRNPSFRKLWLERLSYNLKNTWNPKNLNKRLDELVAIYKPEIARNQKRWWNSVSNWNRSINEVRTFIEERTDHLLEDTQQYFGLTNAQMKKYFGNLWK